MELAHPPIAGFRGARAEILMALKNAQPLTARELAKQFGVTPNALRRHLKELEADGLVSYQREIRGVGGPTFAYRLSAAGEELFPRAYVPALLEAIETVRQTDGSEGVVGIFERQWSALVKGRQQDLANLPMPERARWLAAVLTSQGYMAESQTQSPTEATITEHNCAVRAVAERFPEICAAEARFLSDMLGAAVERQSHILGGCNACEYSVRVTQPDNAAAPARAPDAQIRHLEVKENT